MSPTSQCSKLSLNAFTTTANPGGAIHTGLAGNRYLAVDLNGCKKDLMLCLINAGGSNGGSNKDPLLPVLAMLAMGLMVYRRRHSGTNGPSV